MAFKRELLATGWNMKEIFKQVAADIPRDAKMGLKLFFAPLVGVIKGRPVVYMQDVVREREALYVDTMDKLNARLAENPYRAKGPD